MPRKGSEEHREVMEMRGEKPVEPSKPVTTLSEKSRLAIERNNAIPDKPINKITLEFVNEERLKRGLKKLSNDEFRKIIRNV